MTATPRVIDDPARFLDEVCGIAVTAGEVILRHYAAGATSTSKSDGSPVTQADHDAEAVIVAGLRRLTPDILVVAEEEVEKHGAPDVSARPYWLVDPMDGTKEFLSRTGRMTVNIALVDGEGPVLGIIHTPAQDDLCAAAGPGSAKRHKVTDGRLGAASPISVRVPRESGLVVVASKSHEDENALKRYLGDKKVTETKRLGGAGKFCMVAAGEADLYPRFGGSMEWDTAAGQAIIEAAGGVLTKPDGSHFDYRKKGFLNGAFIARGWQ